MADLETTSVSNATSHDNGFDPPVVTSTKVSTENLDADGDEDLSGASKKDGVDVKIVEEAKAVVEESKGLEELKDAVDNIDVDEVRDVEIPKNVEIKVDVDEKGQGISKDGEEKDQGDIKGLEEKEDGEEKEGARVTIEENEKNDVGVTMHLDGQNDAKDAMDAGKANELEEKDGVKGIMCLEGQKDAVEAKEGDKHRVVGKSMDGEEEKNLCEIENEEGKKIVEKTKNDGEEIVMEEGMNAEKNQVPELVEDNGGKNIVQALDSVKEIGEKNDAGIVEGTWKKIAEGKVHEDDNAVEQLKLKQVEQEITADEHKMDLGSENDTKNISKSDVQLKTKKKSKEAKTGKKKVVVDHNDEKTSLEEEKEGTFEEVHISEEEDVIEDDDDDVGKKHLFRKVTNPSRRKGSRGQTAYNKSEATSKSEIKGKKESRKKPKELQSSTIDAASSPMGSPRERPVRERKIVERLVEVIEKEPNKGVIIEKGRGTPLKDIPNVAYKVARKRPADLKFLHQILFGRRGKVVEYKSNILQFSGFAWHEAEEKQRAKIKEKLDKCIKDSLLDLCDLLDLVVPKTNTKKEEIIVKLVDFLEAPRVTTDAILAEREQSEKSRKRKRFSEGSASRSSGGTSAKSSRKKKVKAEGASKSKGNNRQDTEEDDDEDTENGVQDEDDAPKFSENDEKENEASEASDDDEGKDEVSIDFGKGKQDIEQSLKKEGSASVEKRRARGNTKKVSLDTQVKSPVKTPSSSKQSKVKKNDTAEKVFTRKKRRGSESPEGSDDGGENEDVDDLGKRSQGIKQYPRRQTSSISKKRKRMETSSKSTSQTSGKYPVKTLSSHKQANAEKDDSGEKVFSRKKKDANLPTKSDSKSSAKGKKSVKGKTAEEDRKSGPSKTDLRKTTCEILKEVDFNTATFTDILKKLAAHYKMDLTTKKAAIKQMIQEELTKMADEADDSDDGEKEETPKEETSKSAGKKVKA